MILRAVKSGLANLSHQRVFETLEGVSVDFGKWLEQTPGSPDGPP
jgi:hypothetical protein